MGHTDSYFIIILFRLSVIRVNPMVNENKKFEKLSRSTKEDTKIMAGQTVFTVKQLEDEMVDDKSEIGRKLKSIEHILEKY